MPTSSSPHPIPGSPRPRSERHRHVGPADPNSLIGVTVFVRANPEAPPVPDLERWHRTPIRERQPLSRREFARVHGAHANDLQAVQDFARAHALNVVETSVSSRTVTLIGKVADMERAFEITLHLYEAPRPRGGHRPSGPAPRRVEPEEMHVHHGFDGAVHVPANLREIVVAVIGFDDREIAAPAGDPSGATSLSVPAVAQRYNFPNSGAADQTIAVFTAASNNGAYLANDITNVYFPSLPASYQTAPQLNNVNLTIGGTTFQNNPGAVQALQNTNSSNATTYIFSGQNGGILECTQDICTAATIAQGATINVYFTQNSEQGWLAFFNRVLEPQGEKAPTIVTISWFVWIGDDSSYVGSTSQSGSIVSLMTAQLQSLAAVGVDVFIALGDRGADDWVLSPSGSAPDGNSHVMYPGSDPWVTSCGGTVLGTNQESVWSDAYSSSSFGSSNSNFGATGGGVSQAFTTAPPYQTAIGVTGATDSGGTVRTGRGVPDIAGMVGLQGFFANGLSYSFTGTSCVAPLYAGLFAVLRSALGRAFGPLNDTLYALQNTAYNDIAQGNNSSNDTPANVKLAIPTYTGNTPNAPFFSAGTGWDACSGLGSVDGTKMLNGIASLLYNPNFYIQVNKGSFGLNEVQINATYQTPTPFWLVLEGFTPNAVSAAGINPTIIPALSGVTVTVGAASPEIPSQRNTPQRIYFPCTLTFATSAIKPISQGGIFPNPGNPPTPTQALLVAPSVTIAGRILPAAETVLTLEPGADPYFSNYANNGFFYLSQDLRVFTVTPGINNAPINGVPLKPTDNVNFDTAAGYAYIQALLANLNANFNSPAQGDAFTLFPDQSNALTGDSTVTPTTLNPANVLGTPFANYNFAVARVRIDGAPNSSTNANVRALFRIFASQTSDTDFNSLTYPSSNDVEGQPLAPQVGVGDVTVPFFATGNYETNSDFAVNTDYSANSVNNQPVNIGSSGQAYAYYGCYINVYPTKNTIGGKAVQTLFPSSHSCIVAQLIYDDAPAPIGPGVLQGPEYSDNFAQRNLEITFSDNPGPSSTHRVPQTFDVRPGPPPGTGALEDYPDELMIDWGNTPVGSTASIYWPRVASADVLALADKFYSTHQLAAADANTVRCKVPRGITNVPIPHATGENFAGLFTVDLPQGVIKGEVFTVTVRRISTRRAGDEEPPPPPRINAQQGRAEAEVDAPRLRNWRYVVGTFAVRIPVVTKHEMLLPEENIYSIISWRLAQLEPTNRWIPVLKAWLKLIEGRIIGLGGDPGTITPSPWGSYGPPKPEGGAHGGGRHHHHHEAVGKVCGVLYDRFGDFEGFDLLTEQGHERRFLSREEEIQELVRYAWAHRVVIEVEAPPHEPEHPIRIVLLRRPKRRPWDE